MSFLVDPPLLIGSGVAISKLAPDEETARKLEMATAATFLAGASALYFNAPGTKPVARKLFRSEDGREFMVNSMVFNFDHRKLRGKRSLIGVALLATYPFWLKLGRRLGARA
jgi:hypothetical protein